LPGIPICVMENATVAISERCLVRLRAANHRQLPAVIARRECTFPPVDSFQLRAAPAAGYAYSAARVITNAALHPGRPKPCRELSTFTPR
jgi:hypothetical protein